MPTLPLTSTTSVPLADVLETFANRTSGFRATLSGVELSAAWWILSPKCTLYNCSFNIVTSCHILHFCRSPLETLSVSGLSKLFQGKQVLNKAKTTPWEHWEPIKTVKLAETKAMAWKMLKCYIELKIKNWIHFFITPKIKSRLAKYQQCWRLCGSMEVDHSHVFWNCTKIILGECQQCGEHYFAITNP